MSIVPTMKSHEECSVTVTPFSTTTFYGKERKPKKRRSKVSDEKETGLKGPGSKFPNEFTPRILGPTVCWKTFFRQVDAFQFAQDKAEDVHVFAYESCSDPTKPGTGQRRYLASSLHVFWHYYSQLRPCQKQHYEIIPEGAPCKLYFDLEYQRDSNPGSDGDRMVETLIEYVCGMLRQVYGVHCGRKDVLDLDASTPSKFSRHLIFQGPDVVFENNISQGNFIRYIFGVLQPTTSNTEGGTVHLSPHQVGSSLDERSVSNSQKDTTTRHGQVRTLRNNEDRRGRCPDSGRRCFSDERVDVVNTDEMPSQHFETSFPSLSSSQAEGFYLLPPISGKSGRVTYSSRDESFDNPSDDELCLYSDVSASVSEKYENSTEACRKQDSLLLNLCNGNSKSSSCPIPSSHREGDEGERSSILQAENESSLRESTLDNQSRTEAVKTVLDALNVKDLQSLLVKKKDGTETFLCDLGVYTKNRNFRLYQSCKLNKNNPLKLARENQFTPPSSYGTSKVDEERDTFFASLLTNINLCKETRLLHFDPVSGSGKLTVARQGRKGGTRDKLNTNSGFLCHDDKATLEGWGCSSPYPEIDQFIFQLVSGQEGKNGSIRHWNYWTHHQTLVYDIVGYRWCQNVRRQHKSNNIMYVVDIGSGVFYQKCHDPECQGIKYRSPEMALPRNVLPGFFLETDDFSESPDSRKRTLADASTNMGEEGESEEEMLLLTAVEDVEILQTVGEV